MRVATETSLIMIPGNLILNCVIGFIYDIFGRKVPIMIFMLISACGFAQVPFMTSESDLFLFALCLIPLPVIVTNPFIPDLIDESSHGMANMCRTNIINIGNLTGYGLLLLNATNLAIFSTDVLFSLLTIGIIGSTIMVHFGMKDVIKEGCHTSESTGEKPSVKYLVKQACNLIRTEPIIGLGISGSII